MTSGIRARTMTNTSEVTEGQNQNASKGRSKDVLSSMESRVARVELAMGKLRDKIFDHDEGIEKIVAMGDEIRGEMQGALNQSMDDLQKRNEALEALVVSLRQEV